MSFLFRGVIGSFLLLSSLHLFGTRDWSFVTKIGLRRLATTAVIGLASTLLAGGAAQASTPTPHITGQPTSVVVKSGAQATFRVAATGSSLHYQWQWRSPGSSTWHSIRGATRSSRTMTATSGMDRRVFRVVVRNAHGHATSRSAVLGVALAPKGYDQFVGQAHTDPAVKAGTAMKAQAVATGRYLTYRWYAKAPGSTFKAIAAATRSTYSFVATSTRSGYQYRAVVTNKAGSRTLPTLSLTVLSVPKITTQPASQVAVYSATHQRVVATGGALSYRWQRSLDLKVWTDLWPGTDDRADATLTATDTKSNGIEYFRVLVTNAVGHAVSSTIEVDHFGGHRAGQVVAGSAVDRSGKAVTVASIDNSWGLILGSTTTTADVADATVWSASAQIRVCSLAAGEPVTYGLTHIDMAPSSYATITPTTESSAPSLGQCASTTLAGISQSQATWTEPSGLEWWFKLPIAGGITAHGGIAVQ
ncbi:hypothetical protein [Luteimicrobium subarcticum]|uniref:hypothetical protein n=1 Tax=Luteimicrobium subarcticum TaxID=620910 RepID=UPI0012FD9A7E|nr:hypothetical protein [Luteimicrobium subarcticum]